MRLSRHDKRVALAGQTLIRLDEALSEDELSGFGATGLCESIVDRLECVSLGLCLLNDGFGLALRFKDLRLLLGVGDVDVRLLLALRSKDAGSLASLGLGLQDHRLLDGGRRLDVLDLVPQRIHTPKLAFFFNGRHYFLIQLLALLKQGVEFELADLRPHGRLRQILNSIIVTLDAVRSFIRVIYLDVEDAVNAQLHVVFRHSDLAADLDGLLA